MGTGWKTSKYKSEYCSIAYNLLRGGFTFERLARHLGTSRGVLNGWRKQHKDFAYACECGRDHADADFESMLREAMLMGGVISVPLFKMLYKNRYQIAMQINPTGEYEPFSLRELSDAKVRLKKAKRAAAARERRAAIKRAKASNIKTILKTSEQVAIH